MNYTDVDAGRILSVKGQIGDEISALSRNRDVFRSGILSALEPYWRGQAKDLFTAQFNAFITAFDGFVKSCADLNDRLGAAAGEYNTADSEARRIVTNMPD